MEKEIMEHWEFIKNLFKNNDDIFISKEFINKVDTNIKKQIRLRKLKMIVDECDNK